MSAPPPSAASTAVPPEDAATEESIDTFSSYTPTALPSCIIDALLLSTGVASSTSSTASTTDSSSNEEQDSEAKNKIETHSSSFDSVSDQNVIEILDSDDDEYGSPLVSTKLSRKPPANACSNITKEESSKVDPTKEDSNSIVSDKLAGIPSHSFPACESALLASVSAPRALEESGRCLVDVAKSKALSPLQLEGATLAISRHSRLFFANSNKTVRAGFFLGDAAGIGKGRQISAIIKDSLCRGRSRHLWISVSRELCEDAKRDLHDLGCYCDVHNGSDILSTSKALGSVPARGVLFVTYSLLVSGQGKRMEEIIKWLVGNDGTPDNFSGLLVFDEAHKAKNLNQDTQTAKRVVLLQQRLPHARVVYCSATGVSDISHMVYANRLGLWGAGSALYPTFDSFQQTLLNRGGNRGTGALELLALEMKQAGMFVARTLSWEGAEFETAEICLDEHQMSVYDSAVHWWCWVQQEIKDVLKFLGIAPPKTLWRAYWSAHQRFFKEMCVCVKIPSVASEAMKYIENDYAVVVGLQSTGEASTQCALDDVGEQILLQSGDRDTALRKKKNESIDFNDILMPSLLSTVRSTMTGFVRNHFPVSLPPPEPPTLPPVPPNGFTNETVRLEYLRMQAEAEHIKTLPPPPPIPELIARRTAILEKARELDLPPNPLDDLMDRLGGESQVAEMTGRSGRIVRYKDGKRFHHTKRGGAHSNQKSYGLSMPQSSDECDKVNIVEKKKFMEGSKSVAIISDAASTGISLHSAEGTGAAHKRRVHFTIELPWAADKAIQQLGRTHRSGQRSAPMYNMVVTELGGERRFGAAVAKRMANLGALTKGDRRAATGSNLSEFDIDSVYGRRALNRFYQCVLECDPPTTAPSRHSNAILEKYILDAPDEDRTVAQVRKQDETKQREYVLLVARQALLDMGLGSNESPKKNADVKVFLNRIAGLPVITQKLVFSLFHSTLEDVVGDAKATGEFEGSVEEIKATRIELDAKPEVLAVDARSGAESLLIRMKLDRGISLEAAVAMSQQDTNLVNNDSGKRVAKSGFYVSRRKIAGRELVLFAKRKVEPDVDAAPSAHDPLGLMVITRPNTGKNPCEMASADLDYKYRLQVTSMEMHQLLNEAEESKENNSVARGAATMIRSKYPQFTKLWDCAYRDSDVFEYSNGLAPRRSRVGLVTGAVLHIMPALEKSVLGERLAVDRALRVARVLTVSGQPVVGIRFPFDEEPIGKLKTILKNLADARKCYSDSATLFRDEQFCPVNEKATAWATAERKTIRSFFSSSNSVSARSTPSGSKRKHPSSNLATFSPSAHEQKRIIAKGESQKKTRSTQISSNKRTANIKSFFVKK